MLESPKGPPPNTIVIKEQNSYSQEYISKLKDIVFEEIIQRIENSDKKTDAVDILYTARRKLASKISDAKVISIALKPVWLLFLFEVYLEAQGSI